MRTGIKGIIRLFIISLVTFQFTACGGDTSENSGDSTAVETDAGEFDANIDLGFQPPDTGESLVIAYVKHTRVPTESNPEVWELWVTDEDCRSDDCEEIQITGADLSCQVRCEISPALDYVLWSDPADQSTLKIVPLNEDFTITEESRILLQDIDIWQLGGAHVVYSRDGVISSIDLEGRTDTEIISSISQDGRALPGGFTYISDIGRVIVNIPTSLSAMDLIDASITDPTDQVLLYHFIANVEQTTGSFYQNQMDVSVSPDGQLVSIFTDALDNAESCVSSVSDYECNNDEYYCSSDSDRCIGEQLVLHIINRDESNLLSVPGNSNRCSEDSECGEYHHCDLSYTDTAGLGECAPGKFIIGPYGRYACENTATGAPYLDAGEYENVVDGPLWRSDNTVLITAGNSCVDANIEATDIITINPRDGSIDVVVSSTGGDHGGDACYDEVELDYNPPACNIEIEDIDLSNSGNSIVFIGSSVRSNTDAEAWIIDAYGRDGKEDMTRNILMEIINIQVF